MLSIHICSTMTEHKDNLVARFAAKSPSAVGSLSCAGSRRCLPLPCRRCTMRRVRTASPPTSGVEPPGTPGRQNVGKIRFVQIPRIAEGYLHERVGRQGCCGHGRLKRHRRGDGRGALGGGGRGGRCGEEGGPAVRPRGKDS